MEELTFESGSSVATQSTTVQSPIQDTVSFTEQEGSEIAIEEGEEIVLQTQDIEFGEPEVEVALHDQLVQDLETHKDIDGTLERLASGTLNTPEEPQDDYVQEPMTEEQPDTDIPSSIPEEVLNDPEFQQQVGQIMQEEVVKGKPLDAESIQQRAYERYKQDQILDDVSYESRVKVLEKDVRSVLAEQQHLTEQIARNEYDYLSQEVLIAKMGEIIMELSEMLREEQERKKKGKKISVLELLILMMGAMLLQFASRGPQEGKQEEQDDDSPATHSIAN